MICKYFMYDMLCKGKKQQLFILNNQFIFMYIFFNVLQRRYENTNMHIFPVFSSMKAHLVAIVLREIFIESQCKLFITKNFL